jgi:hypothetical protein
MARPQLDGGANAAKAQREARRRHTMAALRRDDGEAVGRTRRGRNFRRALLLHGRRWRGEGAAWRGKRRAGHWFWWHRGGLLEQEATGACGWEAARRNEEGVEALGGSASVRDVDAIDVQTVRAARLARGTTRI